MNQTVKVFFGFLIMVLLLIGLIWISTPPTASIGTVHPEFSTMLKGGSSVSTSMSVKWLAYCFGLAIIGIFVFLMAIGSHKSEREKNVKIRTWLIMGTALYVLVYTLTVFAYWDYAQTNSTTYFLGFPIATSWMLIGMWFIPLSFTILYIMKFHQWVITPEEMEQFQKIVANRKEKLKN